MNKKDLKKRFPWLTDGEIDYQLRSVRCWYRTERGFLAHLEKENQKFMEEYSMPDVERIYIDITWKKSQTWGYCPHCEWEAWIADGSYRHGTEKARGCGYDKHSTVVADVFNKVCKGMAWRKRNSRKKAPYGICYVGAGAKKDFPPYFEGGVGIECYGSIVSFLGGKMESHHGKTWDSHIITFPKK